MYTAAGTSSPRYRPAPVAADLLVLKAAQLALVGGRLVVALAMLPDSDQRVPGLAHHRVTHTVWFALLVALGLGVTAPDC